ncbi:hypothetical protein ALC57_02961 [Trachymyrmex cornetzi]|uniref:Uncharacterized protein n=1 Tax=Trachymyrmex cornetzi TaxID=471704 RepID=A0A151JMW0_9HYME|nr:hypothetical protein ALC57_02961 [Trachymyrmex cornetzi]
MRRDVCRCKQWIALNRGQRPSLPVLQVSVLGSSALTAAVSGSPAESRSSVGCIESLVVRCVTPVPPVRHTEDKQRPRRIHCTAASESVCSCTYCTRVTPFFSL